MKRPQKLAVMLVPTPPYEICGLRLPLPVSRAFALRSASRSSGLRSLSWRHEPKAKPVREFLRPNEASRTEEF